MKILLLLAALGFALLSLAHRRRTRRQWRQISGMIDAIAAGGRPASFILHGEAALQRIGLGLETLTLQRDRLEAQISREGFSLQTILASMADGVVVVDPSRQVRLVNQALLDGFGLAKPPLGVSLLQALRDPAVDEAVRDALASGETLSREMHHAASGRYLAVSAAPVRDALGGVLGAAAIFHDITRIKQLEEVRRDFVANVSHELRTPLSIFQGYLEMLLENPTMPTGELIETLKVLQRHSARLNFLVEDLLALARLEARQDVFEPVPLSVGELLENVARDWRRKFEAKAVRLKLRAAPGLPPVMGEAFRLEQVMNNLFENALKYTPAEGEVSVEARRLGPEEGGGARFGEVEIRVSDTGGGIAPGDLPHIFERFYRADKARSRALGGTGLGLSIVKHLILLHGGSVRAESDYGRGTTIIVRLPAAPQIA